MRSDGLPRLRLDGGQSARSARCTSRLWTTTPPAFSPRSKNGLASRDDGFEQRHVVAQALAKTAGLDEVALHVDDDQGRGRQLEGVEEGLRVHFDQGAALTLALSRSERGQENTAHSKG